MQTTHIVKANSSKLINRSISCFIVAAGLAASAFGVDSDAKSKEWSFDSSLSRAQLEEKSVTQQRAGQRIADLETYRIGRSEKVSAVWVESEKDEKWLYKEGMSISTLKTEHEEHIEDGYVINEIEAVRIGANLEFSAVWTKQPKQEPTLFFWGMDDMLFSNRYGEMADRGYRLVDFEVYESNGNSFHTAIWKERNPETSVRFYRALGKNDFSKVASKLDEEGFRLVDVEGYRVNDKLVFAGSWEKLQPGQTAKRELDLLVDVFYQKNAEYMANGYRLVDFDAYSQSVTEMRYAGCWVKQGEADEDGNKKDSFIEAFRISSK